MRGGAELELETRSNCARGLQQAGRRTATLLSSSGGAPGLLAIVLLLHGAAGGWAWSVPPAAVAVRSVAAFPLPMLLPGQ